MMVLIPVIIIAAVYVRQDASQLGQPVQIAPPKAGAAAAGDGS